MAGWQKEVKDAGETGKTVRFSEDDVKDWFKEAETQKTTSHINAVLYGEDGVGKSGAAMDCRTEEEIAQGKKVIIIDCDGSALPLREMYYGNDPNILVIDPMILDDKGEIDYIQTYDKVLATVKYVKDHEDTLNLKAVVLDGLDTLLKICEHVMRIEDLKINPDVRLTDRFDWAKRNRRYLTPLIIMKRLKCFKFYTTHLKPRFKYVGGELQEVGRTPNWEKSTPAMMFQKILCERREMGGKIEVTAKIEKCKTNLTLEGKEYSMATIDTKTQEGKWVGLQTFYGEAVEDRTHST